MILNVFSNSGSCPFILLMILFTAQKHFSWMWFHLCIFTFVAVAFGVRFKKNTTGGDGKELASYVCSRSFVALGLTFMFLIHFELFFVYGVRYLPSFILQHVAIQFSQHHLLKRLSCLCCIFLPPLLWINWPYMFALAISGQAISGFAVPLCWYINFFFFLAIPYYFDC